MKQCFILTQFGSPHDWTQKYIENVQKLKPYGYYWKIFTPNKFESKGNVEIIPMSVEGFNDLTEKKLGVNPKMFIVNGMPSFHMTDFNVVLGAIFEDYLQGFDYWGCIGWDILTGRLDHFVKLDCDIWSDDVGAINGTFCLWRNNKEINNLFKKMPNWERYIAQLPCPKCSGTGDKHVLVGTDEYILTELIKDRLTCPKYYPVHGHDRLERHEIELKDDGSLWELNRDIGHPNWKYGHDYFGREIAYYHFMTTKHWPL